MADHTQTPINIAALEPRLHLNCATHTFTDAHLLSLRQVAETLAVKEVKCADKSLGAAAVLFFDGRKDPVLNQLISQERALRIELLNAESISEKYLQGKVARVSSERSRRLEAITGMLDRLLDARPDAAPPKIASHKPLSFWDNLPFFEQSRPPSKPDASAVTIRKFFLEVCDATKKICAIAIENAYEPSAPTVKSGTVKATQTPRQP